MQVELGEREEQFDHLRDDPHLTGVLEAVEQYRFLLKLLIELIRQFQTDKEFQQGLGGERPQQFAERFTRAKRRPGAERRAIGKLVDDLGRLYGKSVGSENLLRGHIVELLVKQALRTRYAATGDVLDDNVKFRLVNGDVYASSRTIDVIGFDTHQEAGEVHDCKLQASGWSKQRAVRWIRELESNAPPRNVRVGLVTITGRDRARPVLQRAGIGQASTLVPLEKLWELVPLFP